MNALPGGGAYGDDEPSQPCALGAPHVDDSALWAADIVDSPPGAEAGRALNGNISVQRTPKCDNTAANIGECLDALDLSALWLHQTRRSL